MAKFRFHFLSKNATNSDAFKIKRWKKNIWNNEFPIKSRNGYEKRIFKIIQCIWKNLPSSCTFLPNRTRTWQLFPNALNYLKYSFFISISRFFLEIHYSKYSYFISRFEKHRIYWQFSIKSGNIWNKLYSEFSIIIIRFIWKHL